MNQTYLISNESSYAHALPTVCNLAAPGGVYIGVGVDQNFTGMAAVGASYGFIVDNRPPNRWLHSLFKACFELAPSPSAYLSVLMGRPAPSSLLPGADMAEMLATYFARTQFDPIFFEEQSARIRDCITRYEKNLSSETWNTFHAMHSCFAYHGLDIKTRFDMDEWHGIKYPTYRDLMPAVDRTGRRWHFLNREEDYLWVKNMQRRNKIVAVTGDMTGKKTLSRLAEFIREKQKIVSTVYVSNIEETLFRENRFEAYVANLRRLPIDKTTTIIRSVVNDPEHTHPAALPGHLFVTVTQRLKRFLTLYEKGAYSTYRDVTMLDYRV
ncbi:MAG: hypothetical protein FJY97_08400 [candidate division Zixibacteria bacterium]|nr:hypothetical protein [candidate division Zixibacteria bacterium]